MAAEEEIGPRFYHRCSTPIRLSDKNKTATGKKRGWSGTSFRMGTVFSSLPLHKLPKHRFVFKEQRYDECSVRYIGVTRSDPGDLEEIPDLAQQVPQTWCLDLITAVRYENSRRVDTGKDTWETQQEGDIWCVEVTPGGQVYIYHNNSQPWGSPAFTLPPDTTQVWAVVTLRWSSFSVVQDPSWALLGYDTNIFLHSLLGNISMDNQNKITGEYVRHITPLISKSNLAGTKAVCRSVVDFCLHTNLSCRDLRQLLVTGRVIEIMQGMQLIVEVNIANLFFPYLRELAIVPGFITNDKTLYLIWSKSQPEFLFNILSFINLCGKSQNELYFPEVDSMLASILNRACKEGHININLLDDKGWAPLHYTAHCGLTLATQELLRNPYVDVNLKNKEEDTALLLAIKTIPNTTCYVPTNWLDILVVLKSRSTLDLNALDLLHADTLFALKNKGVQLLVSGGLEETTAFDLCWKDNLDRSFVDFNLLDIDSVGWECTRPFINYIMKNKSWTGHTILPDEYSADVTSSMNEDRSSDYEHCHHGLNKSSMKTWKWLLALDDAIQIPGHTQQSPVYQRDVTQGIGRTNICEKCVTEHREFYSIAESYALKAKEEMQRKFPELQFELQAIGSYIQDLKILKPDEFDFLLIIENASEDEGDMCDDAQNYGATWFAEQSELVQKREHPDPRIISLYPHGPAWCLECTLLKKRNRCDISVDITLAVKQVGKSMKDFCKKIKGHRIFNHIYKSLTDDELLVNLGPEKYGVTSCTVLMKLIARLSYMLPHVATVIRIVKLIVGIFLRE